jgi:hypothetical protein
MNEEYINLVLTMLSTYEEYGVDMKFSKDDIDQIIKNHNVLKDIKCNELGWILLLRHNYVTPEVFANKMDLEYDNNKYWFVLDSFKDIIPGYETEANILYGDYVWEPGDFYEVDVEDYFSDYTEKTLNCIINFCDKKGLEFENEDETILLSKDNMTVIKGDILINNDIEMSHNIDDIDELKTSLNTAICDAQESANTSALYNKIKREFIKEIGDFKYKKIKIKGEDKSKLLVELDTSWSDIEKALIEQYSPYDFQEEFYGNIISLMKELDFFDGFSGVDLDNNYYGTIDNNILNEYTRNRLDWD